MSSSTGFVEITTVKGTPVQDGKLGVWDLSVLVEGEYTLRLTVKNSNDTVDVTRNNLMVKGQKVVTFKLHLDKGWNLISFPGDVIEPSSPDGFEGTEIRDANDRTPDSFELGEAYWASAIGDTDREVKLIPKKQYTRSVKMGWNLIGSVYGDARIPECVSQLHCWNAKEKKPGRTFLIEEGVGYWALAPWGDCEITVKTKPPDKPTAPAFTPDSSPLFPKQASRNFYCR